MLGTPYTRQAVQSGHMSYPGELVMAVLAVRSFAACFRFAERRSFYRRRYTCRDLIPASVSRPRHHISSLSARRVVMVLRGAQPAQTPCSWDIDNLMRARVKCKPRCRLCVMQQVQRSVAVHVYYWKRGMTTLRVSACTYMHNI